LEELVAIEDGPWALMFEDALKHDKLQTAASKLARMLKEYKIKPRTVKLADETTAKGYHRRDFEAIWKRYLRASCSSCEKAVTAVTHEGKEVTATIPVTATGQKAVTQLPRRENAKGYEVTAVTAMPGREQKAPSEAANDEPSEDIGPLVYPGDWLRHSPDNPLPAWASVNLKAHCELCGEAIGADPHWFISRTDFGRVRCPCCQEAKWWAQGFEVEDGFPYGDCQASAEERIAERDRTALQEWGRWLKMPDGQALLRETNTQWWEALVLENDSTRQYFGIINKGNVVMRKDDVHFHVFMRQERIPTHVLNKLTDFRQVKIAGNPYVELKETLDGPVFPGNATAVANIEVQSLNFEVHDFLYYLSTASALFPRRCKIDNTTRRISGTGFMSWFHVIPKDGEAKVITPQQKIAEMVAAGKATVRPSSFVNEE
jgi:hypothetical protein